jgi:hypothetical protein
MKKHKKNNKFKKFLLIFILIFSTFPIIFFALQKNPKNLDGTRVKLVDSVGQNYFFRGSNPFVNKLGEKVFSYHDLKKYINQTLEKEGKKPLKDFYLVDISLLNLDAYFQIKEEQEFFKKYPHLGEVKNYSEIAPELLLTPFSSNPIAYKITKNYHEKLTKLLQEIRQTLEKESDKPIVIYAHCNAGRDRTGALSASYRMLYQNMDFPQAVNKNIEEVQRSAESLLKSSVSSYCNYLEKEHKQKKNSCGE